jgi:hypothetical protein
MSVSDILASIESARHRVSPCVKAPRVPVVTRAFLFVEEGNPRIKTASEEPGATRISPELETIGV